MNVECKDFISVFSNVYPEGFCGHLCSEFDRLQELGFGSNRQTSERALKHTKNDTNIMLGVPQHEFQDFNGQSTVSLLGMGMQKCFDTYTKEFSTLADINIVSTALKMQKTSRGGGYHIWHHEQGNDYSSSRCLVYSIYCNTLPETAKGETEFLYQEQTIRPIENTAVIWPAAFTHVHRGNPVYGDYSKYIITGWFYLT